MKIKTWLFTLAIAFAGFVILPFFFISINEQFSLPIYNIPYFRLIGLILILSGAGTFLHCYGLFSHHGKGTHSHIEPTLRFVSGGIYKYTRNPMYFAFFLILLAEFFIFGYLMLLAYSIIYMISIHCFVVYHEEPILRKKFGTPYIKYCKKVPRWIFI